MEYTTLTGTGMEVSRICLGSMSFSEQGEGWNIDRAQSRAIVERAIELGITFFDTANTYNDGESERILGDVIGEYDPERFVVATKGRWGGGRDDGRDVGLSRKALDIQISDSLDRLGLDTIDLYQIHRWDDDTPIEVTVRALDDAVSRGDIRYTGASSMWTYQLVEALQTSQELGLERFRTMQPYYNAGYRERERELLPYCNKKDIGVIPWSPLQHGYLARPDEEWTDTDRGESLRDNSHPIRDGNNPEVNRRIQEIADQKGVSMAQIALRWLLEQDSVDAPILGVTSIDHLEDAVAAVDIDLSVQEVEFIEEPYEPVRVSGWDGARKRMGYE